VNNEHVRQSQDHRPKKRVNIVISDMDTSNTCDRPLIKFLWKICCEWNCSSTGFRKFQVEHRKVNFWKIICDLFRISWQYLSWMHSSIYLS